MARVMSKCVKSIYNQRHESLVPLWNAACEIRQELGRFAEQHMNDAKYDLFGDRTPTERGICQVMISTSEMPPQGAWYSMLTRC